MPKTILHNGMRLLLATAQEIRERRRQVLQYAPLGSYLVVDGAPQSNGQIRPVVRVPSRPLQLNEVFLWNNGICIEYRPRYLLQLRPETYGNREKSP